MRYVTAVNRSSKVLTGTWNGRQYSVEPGKHMFPENVAKALKRQNPIMGTQDNRFLTMKYLIGIEDYGDDCSPVEQSNSAELWDRNTLPPAQRKAEVVPGDNGIYSIQDVVSFQPTSGGFVKP